MRAPYHGRRRRAVAWRAALALHHRRQDVPEQRVSHAPGGVEISVSRAGGGTEANIQRWIGQFDNTGREGRVEKTVHGLHVVTVDVAGTYVGGGMAMGGGAAEAKPDWALVGAIVESVSPPYFFKMTGPAAAVRAARPAFDRLVDHLTPT